MIQSERLFHEVYLVTRFSVLSASTLRVGYRFCTHSSRPRGGPHLASNPLARVYHSLARALGSPRWRCTIPLSQRLFWKSRRMNELLGRTNHSTPLHIPSSQCPESRPVSLPLTLHQTYEGDYGSAPGCETRSEVPSEAVFLSRSGRRRAAISRGSDPLASEYLGGSGKRHSALVIDVAEPRESRGGTQVSLFLMWRCGSISSPLASFLGSCQFEFGSVARRRENAPVGCSVFILCRCLTGASFWETDTPHTPLSR